MTVNDQKFTIKDFHHINFNHPNAPDILDEHHVKGEYPSPKSFPTNYTDKVNFTQLIETYDFKVYGEEYSLYNIYHVISSDYYKKKFLK